MQKLRQISRIPWKNCIESFNQSELLSTEIDFSKF